MVKKIHKSQPALKLIPAKIQSQVQERMIQKRVRVQMNSNLVRQVVVKESKRVNPIHKTQVVDRELDNRKMPLIQKKQIVNHQAVDKQPEKVREAREIQKRQRLIGYLAKTLNLAQEVTIQKQARVKNRMIQALQIVGKANNLRNQRHKLQAEKKEPEENHLLPELEKNRS